MRLVAPALDVDWSLEARLQRAVWPVSRWLACDQIDDYIVIHAILYLLIVIARAEPRKGTLDDSRITDRSQSKFDATPPFEISRPSP